jgi:hypothetical protein
MSPPIARIVAINNAPTVCNEDGTIRSDVTDLNQIVANIDSCNGRNDALRAYVYALRDLQRAHDRFAYGDVDDAREIDAAQAAVAAAFDRLILAEFTLNRAL